MKAFTEDEITSIMDRLAEMEQVVNELQKQTTDTFYDNDTFLKVMNISKRTAQSWRSENIIPYSQAGTKIYYFHADILSLLKNNYNPIKKKIVN